MSKGQEDRPKTMVESLEELKAAGTQLGNKIEAELNKLLAFAEGLDAAFTSKDSPKHVVEKKDKRWWKRNGR